MKTSARTRSAVPAAFLIPLGVLGLLVVLVVLIGSRVEAGRARTRVERVSAPLRGLDPEFSFRPAPAASIYVAPAPVVVADVEAAPVRTRRPITIRTVLTGALGMFAGVGIAAMFATGSYALWNRVEPITDVVVTSGDLAFTVQSGSTAAGATTAIDATAWSRMLPGDMVSQQIVLTSTGSARSDVAVSATGGAGFQLHVSKSTCAAATTWVSLSGTPTALGEWLGYSTSPVCVRVTLPTGAANAMQTTAAAPFTITFAATQKANP